MIGTMIGGPVDDWQIDRQMIGGMADDRQMSDGMADDRRRVSGLYDGIRRFMVIG